MAEDLRAARRKLGITSTVAAELADLELPLYRAPEEDGVVKDIGNVGLMVSAARCLGVEELRVTYVSRRTRVRQIEARAGLDSATSARLRSPSNSRRPTFESAGSRTAGIDPLRPRLTHRESRSPHTRGRSRRSSHTVLAGQFPSTRRDRPLKTRPERPPHSDPSRTRG